jgi:hypothetical protein
VKRLDLHQIAWGIDFVASPDISKICTQISCSNRLMHLRLSALPL